MTYRYQESKITEWQSKVELTFNWTEDHLKASLTFAVTGKFWCSQLKDDSLRSYFACIQNRLLIAIIARDKLDKEQADQLIKLFTID